MVKSKAGESAVVHIEVTDGMPSFQFSGSWGVREALAVQRNFSREYRRHLKVRRRPKQEVVNERSEE